jgi:hypothetical protein
MPPELQCSPANQMFTARARVQPSSPAPGTSATQMWTFQFLVVASVSGLLSAADRNVKCGANLAHSHVAQTSNPLYQNRNRNTLERIKVDRASVTNRIVSWLEDYFAWEIANGRRARCDQRSP